MSTRAIRDCHHRVSGCWNPRPLVGRWCEDAPTLGAEVAVKASVHTLGGLSAHADQADLLWWCQGFAEPPEKVFITHGEDTASENLSSVLVSELGWARPIRPKRGESFPC
ncbi:MAG: MBL fold metallo-hydrolase RNA specificity domain-containing protein [Burkholderiales bacterium]